MEPIYGVHDIHELCGKVTVPRENTDLDIVAVHGLGGHAVETWTHAKTGTCWIKDLLQDRLPKRARILVFGYNAKRFHHDAELDFLDVARQLLSGLHGHRESGDQGIHRPIIFIAHSLGGLVVKKAVTLGTRESHSIAACLHGFVFFATPYSGSHLADAAAKLETFTRHMNVPHSFLRDLCTNSKELNALGENFRSFLDESRIPCLTFHELQKTKRGLFIKDIIVSRDSAILGFENESIVPVNANHSNIVRFPHANDNNFHSVLQNITLLVKHPCHVEAAPRRSRAAQLFVPFMPRSYFLGRDDELQRMRRLFLPDRPPAHKSIALYGQSGVGKTQLALKYSIDNREQYDYVFFVNAQSIDSLRNEFIKLHSSLKIPEGSGDAVTEIQNWLAHQTDHRWLMVLDNANTLSNVVPFLRPIALFGHILLTCTDGRIKDSELVDEALAIGMMSPEESQRLLLTRAALKSSQLDEVEVATALVKELGYLPLAIDSAGAYINLRQKTVGQYTQLFHSYTQDILDHRPEASSYPLSVLGTLEVSFDLVDNNPDASLLLSAFAFLDRSEIIEQFLRRASIGQWRWATNGEPERVELATSYVLSEFCSLLDNDFRFDDAIEVLTSLSIIQCNKREEVGRYFLLHPLTHRCARMRMSSTKKQIEANRTLCILTHAFPNDELVLEKGSGILGTAYMAHIYVCYDTFKEPESTLFVDSPEKVASGGSRMTLSEQTAFMILNANITYGEGDETKNKYLLDWADALLLESTSMYLKGRALEVRLAIGYYEQGDYVGGAAAVRQFLPGMKAVIEVEGLDQRTNAQLGLLEITLAELLTTEVTLDADFRQSLELLRQWKPLDPDSPSHKERTTLGILSQTLGQVYKDTGDWLASAEELKHYLQDYVVIGSQNEGWGVGDYAQVLMEMGRINDAEEALHALINKRSTDMTDDEKRRDRRSDIMFIDIQWGECMYLLGRYTEAEQVCLQLRAKFDSFGDLWHFEKTRYFSILCALARIAQATKEYGKALGFWEQALSYATDIMDTGFRKGKWCRSAFLVSVVIYSLADCLYQLEDLQKAITLRQEAEETLNSHQKACWMLGLGTYWLQEVKDRMNARPVEAKRVGAK